jgi:hypothetical protein
MTFEVEPSDSIEKLKLQIENMIGLEPHCQRLICSGHKLDPLCTFSDYNIENESAIHMVHRTKDCNLHKSS